VAGALRGARAHQQPDGFPAARGRVAGLSMAGLALFLLVGTFVLFLRFVAKLVIQWVLDI
jgi:hypothetical protein